MKNLLVSLFIIITIVSCSNEVVAPIDEVKAPVDDAKDPVDENSDLGHDLWDNVSFIFTEGEIKGGKFIGYKNDKNLIFKTVQKYKFKSVGDEVVPDGVTIKLITGKTYGLEIEYYNSNNTLINKQFTTVEMAPIHQHFFITDPIEGTLLQKEKNTIDYVYRDTNITDKMLGEQDVFLRGEKDPIGLKGYFNVFKKAPHTFDLNVILVHILGGGKLRKGIPYPFHRPSADIIGVQDFYQKIPMEIIAEEGMPTYVDDIAKAFNTTSQKVNEDINSRTLGNKLKL